MHFKIVLAYDGGEFVGWQRQATGTSIQGLIEEALADLDGRPVTVAGAGRTDAGVHALGQVATFSLEREIACASLVGALNARLPRAVRVLEALQVPATFHARFGARGKRYRYRIWNGAVMNPFERHHAWHVADRLDTDAMATAAEALVGRHDFAAFRAAGSSVATSDRTVLSSEVFVAGPSERSPSLTTMGGRLVVCEICGTGFLRHMVRTVAGTLVEIGLGRRPPAWMGEVLSSGSRAQAGPTAPAEGLVLVEVMYGSGLATEP